ncbi:Amuc_1100 family pilus-like protein [Pelagicoccus albus]|uniref:Uncharacterized protein n=1 Tax=Pelagicoccus albus TaxID=415222 RepID=A0A7X1E7L1_9BACT|nr:Amuc_1100 family pilus-like protein [Pelagicoccus albus]MBC2605253.1 hypothetical protein [Pelagicoccus albus]
MRFLKNNPVFYTLVLIMAGAFLWGLWYLFKLDRELSLIEDSYVTKSSQYDRYLASRPLPTRSNLEAIQENYRDLYESYEKAMGNLNLNTFDQEVFYGRTPVSRADWSFAFHRFKENARYSALSNGIELAPNAEFGFESFGNGTPPEDQMESIHQQTVVVSALLETLFESGVQSFVKVQRGQLPEKGRTAAINRRQEDLLYNEGSQFAVLPGQSLSIPGTFDSYVYRLVFRGQSFALRSFLNRISNSSLPFVVRGVEAGLSSEGGEKTGLESIAENPFVNSAKAFESQTGAVPIISDNTSLFVVTVEFLKLSVEIPEPISKEGEDRA